MRSRAGWREVGEYYEHRHYNTDLQRDFDLPDQLTQVTSCLAENLEAPHSTLTKGDTCTGWHPPLWRKPRLRHHRWFPKPSKFEFRVSASNCSSIQWGCNGREPHSPCCSHPDNEAAHCLLLPWFALYRLCFQQSIMPLQNLLLNEMQAIQNTSPYVSEVAHMIQPLPCSSSRSSLLCPSSTMLDLPFASCSAVNPQTGQETCLALHPAPAPTRVPPEAHAFLFGSQQLPNIQICFLIRLLWHLALHTQTHLMTVTVGRGIWAAFLQKELAPCQPIPTAFQGCEWEHSLHLACDTACFTNGDIINAALLWSILDQCNTYCLFWETELQKK